jgi:hypothetical protein
MKRDCNVDVETPRFNDSCLKVGIATFEVSINNLAEFLSGINELDVTPAFNVVAEE